jgi:hypothetical protein
LNPSLPKRWRLFSLPHHYRLPPTPVPEPSLPSIYVIRDAAGIAVDLSLQSAGPEHRGRRRRRLRVYYIPRTKGMLQEVPFANVAKFEDVPP